MKNHKTKVQNFFLAVDQIEISVIFFLIKHNSSREKKWSDEDKWFCAIYFHFPEWMKRELNDCLSVDQTNNILKKEIFEN